MKTWTETRTAKDPEAFVAAFANHPVVTARLVEVLPGVTASGRRRFRVEFTRIER